MLGRHCACGHNVPPLPGHPALPPYLAASAGQPPTPRSRASLIERGAQADDHPCTSTQEDETALQGDSAGAPLPLRKRMALIVRLGEKRILRATRAKLDADFPAGAPAQEGKKKEKKRARDADGAAKSSSSSSGKKAKVKQ